MTQPSEGLTMRQCLVSPILVPIVLLRILTIALSIVFGVVAKLLERGRVGIGNHFYWPFVVLGRLIDGSPRWQPHDLKLDKQPRTEEERARAAAHPHVVKAQCLCPDPECDNKKNPKYVWTDHHIDNKAIVEPMFEQASMAIFENAKKAAAYDQLQEVTVNQLQTIEAQRVMLEEMRQLADRDFREIKLLTTELVALKEAKESLASTYRAS